jgi:hypothetical protein
MIKYFKTFNKIIILIGLIIVIPISYILYSSYENQRKEIGCVSINPKLLGEIIKIRKLLEENQKQG